MPTSSRSSDSTADRSRSPLAALSKYDLVLALIPVAFIAGTGTSVAVDVPLHVGLFVGSLVGALFVADALFRDPPVAATGSGSGSGSGTAGAADD